MPGPAAILAIIVYNFSPPILRFTGPTTHRWKQEKIPQAARVSRILSLEPELFTVDSSRRPSREARARAQAPRVRGACNFSK